MAGYKLPKIEKPKKTKSKQVLLVANGDLRETANRVCWEAQQAMEAQLATAVKACGYELVRAHPFKKTVEHGFISSQKEGLEVFAQIDPKAKLIVAEAVWQYSHHVLAGLRKHQGPILTIANWSGTWPGLVGLLNLNGLIGLNDEMNSKTLPAVQMPNRDGFIIDDRPDTQAVRCMKDCK